VGGKKIEERRLLLLENNCGREGVQWVNTALPQPWPRLAGMVAGKRVVPSRSFAPLTANSTNKPASTAYLLQTVAYYDKFPRHHHRYSPSVRLFGNKYPFPQPPPITRIFSTFLPHTRRVIGAIGFSIYIPPFFLYASMSASLFLHYR
jgi:hypothetical protein